MLWATRKTRNSANMAIESPLSRSTRRMRFLRSRAGGASVRALAAVQLPTYLGGSHVHPSVSAGAYGARSRPCSGATPLAPVEVGSVGQPDPVLAGQGRLGGEHPVDLAQDPGAGRVREGGDEADRGEPVQHRGPGQVVQVVEAPVAQGREPVGGVEGDRKSVV